MSEKRFTLEQWTEKSLYFSDGEYPAHMSIGYICKKVEKKLNEQSDTIEGLILDRNRQEEKLDIARRNLSKQLEKIEELAEENEQLRILLNEAEDMIETRLAEHYIKQYKNIKKGILDD